MRLARSGDAKRRASFEALQNYQGHWSRKDHGPAELRRLAVVEPSPKRAEALEDLAAVLEVVRSGRRPTRRGGFERGAFEGGSITALAHGSEAKARRLWRLLRAYRAAGLRGVFAGWLATVRQGYQKHPAEADRERLRQLQERLEERERRRQLRDEARARREQQRAFMAQIRAELAAEAKARKATREQRRAARERFEAEQRDAREARRARRRGAKPRTSAPSCPREAAPLRQRDLWENEIRKHAARRSGAPAGAA